ncbi:hypothetical protein F4808DRAFT_220418 [Astrocystis sublimbata]|nr:hypothetical protein F4808DRAFT_220418 [Astrocystis sublimbata]
MMASKTSASRQNQLWDRFQHHSGLPEQHIALFRDVVIDCEHEWQTLQENSEGIDSEFEEDSDAEERRVRAPHFKPDGSEFTLADVPFKSLVDAVEEHIQMFIPEHSRTEVYEDIFKGIHGVKKFPRWDRQLDNPRATPQTSFSESRAPLESRIGNEPIFEKFASASDLSLETLRRIRGMIAWRDSARSNGTWGAIAWGTFEVTGGRLGPTTKHTLGDVPHCYVRDRLMLATLVDVDPERRDYVRKRVFPDLTASQIQEYAAAVEEIERQAKPHKPAKIKKAQKLPKSAAHDRKVREIAERKKINSPEAQCIVEEDQQLDLIDGSVNLEPNPEFVALMKKNVEKGEASIFTSIKRSAIRPDAQVQKDDDVSVPVECDIDRDCDQIRAMIKILVREGHWSIDQFVRALSGLRHRQVIQFLSHRGTQKGKESAVFQRSWDFFKRRELLGFDLAAPPPKPPSVMRELAQLRGAGLNRAPKRQNGADSSRAGKAQKTSR